MSDATATFWNWALDERRQTDAVLEAFLTERMGSADWALTWMEAHPYPELPYIPNPPEIP